MPETVPGNQAYEYNIHVRRGVWIVWTVMMLVAAVVYAGKAADERSAFVRWRHQVLEIGDGVNIWAKYYFPVPPLLPLTLYPLMMLPPVVGAVAWFVIKVAMTTWSALTLMTMTRGKGRGFPPWTIGLILLLALRPILSDLQHGNINLLILFLVVAALSAWQRKKDVRAGILLALAITYKVTPALFVPYLMYKRSWRAVGSTLVGVAVFFFVVPSVFLGPAFNWQCLQKWRQNIISPFVEGDVIPSTQEVNQSMAGVLTRLLTQTPQEGEHLNGYTEHDLNLVSWDPEHVTILIKGLAIGLVLLGAFVCRTKSGRRDDPRWIGEFSLVVLTMLFVSERSWKHHFVTLLFPFTYLVYQMVVVPLPKRVRLTIAGWLALSTLLMASTSSELGGLLHGGDGHEIALYFGLFFWSGVALYIPTAWRVWVDAKRPAAFDEAAVARDAAIPAPHLDRSASGVPST